MTVISLKVKDGYGNVSFLTVASNRAVQLTASNGTPLSLSNIVLDHATECRLVLEQASTAREALAVLKKYSHCQVEIFDAKATLAALVK